MPSLQPEPGLRCITIRDLVLPCRIGVSEEERRLAQPVRLGVRLLVAEEPVIDDDLSSVVDYTRIIDRVREAVAGPPLHLVESLAERIADACLFDPRIRRVRVRVEKPQAVEEAHVAVAIERRAVVR